MSTIELTPTDLQKFNITDATIAQYREAFLKLRINGLHDKEGLTKVHEARMTIVKKRTEIERVRKELKADALEYGRKVDGEAKRIAALLEPIESHLSTEEQKIEDEKEELRQAEIRKEEARIQARTDKLIEQGMNYNGRVYLLGPYIISPTEIKTDTDAEFEGILSNIKNYNDELKAKKAEEDRKAKEEKAWLEKIAKEQEAEKLRLENTRKEQEKKAKEIKAAQDKIEAEKKAIEDAKKAEEQRKKDALIKDRKNILIQAGFIYDGVSFFIRGSEKPERIFGDDLAIPSEKDFNSYVEVGKKELKKLADAKAKQDEIDKQKAIDDALEAERLKKEREEKKRLADEEKERKRIAREEKLKPDKEKLSNLANNVNAFIGDIKIFPKTEEARDILTDFITGIMEQLVNLRNRIEKELK